MWSAATSRGSGAVRDITAVAGVVLAAGAGRRLGRPKALVSLGGQLLVERAIAIASDGGCEPVIVVLGSHSDEVLARADLGAARPVLAENWSQGMGASLRAGIDAAEALGCEAIAVILVDQPRIGPDALRRLLAAWQLGASAAVATYDGQPRNPVVLDRSIWAEVRDAASGDVGARGWLRANPDRVVEVACEGTGDPVDIDTPEDLDALQEAP
jgi:CTP:molybdopterin cytidylyltransferase MocA